MDISELYRGKIISLNSFLDMIKPGSTIFVSSEPASPLLVIDALIDTNKVNIMDLQMIQLVTLGSFISPFECDILHFRLKTFHIGESFSRDICYGNFDYIPAAIVDIPKIFSRNMLNIDIAVIALSKPDEDGYMSPGISVDVASLAAEKASLVIAEVNENMPVTCTDSRIHINDVDFIIESDKPLIERSRGEYDVIMDRIGWNISNIIRDGSTVVLHAGSIFDALSRNLKGKQDLRVLTSVVSDWAIDLVGSGALISEKNGEGIYPIMTTSAYGTNRLYSYVHNNKNIRFMSLLDLIEAGRTKAASRLVSILNIQKTDITCSTVQFHLRDNILSGFPSKFQFAIQAADAEHGQVICALHSIDREGESNIVISLEHEHERVRTTLGIVRYVVTEYGIASLLGKSVRERVMALIDIAHPTYRDMLLEQAKEGGYIYKDQIYVTSNAVNYPEAYETVKSFGSDIDIKFRPIKPTDEDMLRRQFYTFSDNARYMRYFSAIRTMPHKNIQKYVNIDYKNTLSIVGIYNDGSGNRIVAEGRFALYKETSMYEMGFAVDEEFQGLGIATFLLNYLIRIAREYGIDTLTASVLPENTAMIQVFNKATVKPQIIEAGGYLEVIFRLSDL